MHIIDVSDGGNVVASLVVYVGVYFLDLNGWGVYLDVFVWVTFLYG